MECYPASLNGCGVWHSKNQSTQHQDSNMQNPRDIIAANVGQKLVRFQWADLAEKLEVPPRWSLIPGYKFKIFRHEDMVLEDIEMLRETLSYTK